MPRRSDSARTRDGAPPPVSSFYASVLDEAELAAAFEVEGVDDELAILRMRLKALLDERPEEFELMLKGVQMILRAAGARYRMSAKSKQDLGHTLAALVEGTGAALFPEEAIDA
ncbi:MAG: hypothetical protein HY874_08385 [Chloroflexi bacterium]|nr:hypothetical protein [Chloroflexota bacterium]